MYHCFIGKLVWGSGPLSHHRQTGRCHCQNSPGWGKYTSVDWYVVSSPDPKEPYDLLTYLCVHCSTFEPFLKRKKLDCCFCRPRQNLWYWHRSKIQRGCHRWIIYFCMYLICKLTNTKRQQWEYNLYTPRNEVVGWYTGFTMSVRL